MRSNIAYSLSESSQNTGLVYSREEIEEKQAIVPELDIFEFQQVFTGRGKISNYLTITIKSEVNILSRANELHKKYNIDYLDTAQTSDAFYVRYQFGAPCSKDSLNKKRDLLLYVYGAGCEAVYGFPVDKSYEVLGKMLTQGNLEALDRKVFPRDGLTGVNKTEFAKVNKLDISDVCSKLGMNDDTNIDLVLNIHYIFGGVFDTATHLLGSIESAMEFFNAGYDRKFIPPDTAEATYKGEGVLIGDDSLIRLPGGYYVDKDGDMVKITDFHIAVHSSYKTSEGIGYVVTLIGANGDKAEKIDYLNTSNKRRLGDFFMALGNFHFYGSDIHGSMLHALISIQNVPEVSTNSGYGWTKDGAYCLFANGIYERKEKIFHESENDTSVLYLPGGNGILPIDQQGRPMLKGARQNVSRYRTGQSIISPDKVLGMLSEMWRDDTGMQVFLVACGILGSGLSGLKKDVPIYFVRGITKSGKTTLSRMVHTLCGFTGEASTMGGTSFTFLSTLGLADNLPVFFSESRKSSRSMEDKVGYLRSLFDRTVVPRGRADMTVVEYPLTAIAYIEGEEMMRDGATRSRCIQLNPKKKNQIKSIDFEDKMQKFTEYAQYFIESYYELADTKKWNEYKREFHDLFSTHYHGRLLSNMTVLYCSAMIYAPQLQSQFISTIENLFELQSTDEEENGTSMDIVKSVSAILQRDEIDIYISDDGFVMGWQAIVEYMTKYRHEVSLSPDSYKEHLDGLGYIVDYYEVRNGVGNDVLIEGPKFLFKDIDKRLLCNTRVYSAYKAYQSKITIINSK